MTWKQRTDRIKQAQNSVGQTNGHQPADGGYQREGPQGVVEQDAVNLTEKNYVRKHYYDKAESSNSGLPMRCTLDSAQVASLACHSYWP